MKYQGAEQQPPEEQNPNAEAARYRVRLRETEAQLATTTEHLARFQRQAAERTVADVLDDPADLWAIGQVDLTEFINADTGDLDETALLGAASALVDQRPKLGKNYQQFGSGLPQHRNWGQGGGVPSQNVGWDSVIGNR